MQFLNRIVRILKLLFGLFDLKRKNFLLIIFLIALGIYVYQQNSSSYNDIENRTKIDTRVNNLILNENDTSIYNVAINEPTELDFLTKKQIFDLRKQYAAQTPTILPSDYSPSDIVFGQIEDNKPWWGLLTNEPGEQSIDGRSEESRFINNPLLFFGINNGYIKHIRKNEQSEIYAKPISISINPSKKTIYVTYDILGYYRDLGLLFDDNTFRIEGGVGDLVFECVNARDFGYNYAYAYSSQNISYGEHVNNLSTGVQQLQDFIHTGGSCGYNGGCNNASPYQDYLFFRAPMTLPAQMAIKLWKKKPINENSPADLYYFVNFQ